MNAPESIFTGVQQQARRGAALSPEFRASLPRKKSLGKGKYGIRYSYRRFGGDHVFTRWFTTEEARDREFRNMKQATKRTGVNQLSPFRAYSIYHVLTTCQRAVEE